MKNFLKTITTLGVFSASTLALAQPNLLNCSSDDGVHKVHLSTSSFAGTPTMSVTVDDQAIKSSNQPVVERTVFGTLYSVIDARRALVDGPAYIYSVVLPSISGGSGLRQVEFETTLILGVSAGRIAPGYPHQHINEIVKLQCQGQSVVF